MRKKKQYVAIPTMRELLSRIEALEKAVKVSKTKTKENEKA